MEKNRILITGASGNIGTKLSVALKGKYDLTLLDRRISVTEDIIQADLSHYRREWVSYFKGVHTVIHLAGNPHVGATWSELVPDNIDCVLNVCKASVVNGVKRLIFASSNHTMGGYREEDVRMITADMEPRPDCDYGASKLFGERIMRFYSSHYSVSVICLRIGSVYPGREIPDSGADDWRKSLWLSNSDMIQIFERSIEVKGIGFEILYAMSRYGIRQWDLERTISVLDYQPEDNLPWKIPVSETEGGKRSIDKYK